MKISYEKSVDSLLIDLVNIQPGDITTTDSFSVEDKIEFGSIHLDFNKEGKIVGIEIMPASKYLPKELIDSVEQIG